MEIDFDSQTNQGILSYLRRSQSEDEPSGVPGYTRSTSPDDVDDPYMNLGTHPDLVQRLWDEVPVLLPERCAWVVYGSPVLAHPSSGIIFAFAGGTHAYALRLPPNAYAEAISGGAERVHHYPACPELDIDASTFDLSAVGEGWVFGRWLSGEEAWCLAAYHHAHYAHIA